MSTHPNSRTAVVLYTRDLRVHDHPGLVEAARSSEYVIPVFVLDDDHLDRAGPNRIAFLVEALGDLRESLRQRGADLVIRRGDPVAETLRLCRDVGAETVFVGEDVTPYARRREQRLATACQSVGIELRVEDGVTVVQPAERSLPTTAITTGSSRRTGDADVSARRRPLSAPTRLRFPSGVAASELTPVHGLDGWSPSPGVRLEAARAKGAGVSSAGSPTGCRRTPGAGIGSMSTARFGSAPTSTSGASSAARGCYACARAPRFRRVRSSALLRRDFLHQLLAGNPETTHRDLHPGTDDRRPDHDALERWRGGLTGYPIVDAGMRSSLEGWLPNRAGLIVG